MLTGFHARNLKGLAEVQITLGQLTVLVGPNGVGKSTVLEGLHVLLQLAAPPGPRQAQYSMGVAGWLLRRRLSLPHLLRKPDARALWLAVEVAPEGRFAAHLEVDEAGELASIRLTRMDGQLLEYTGGHVPNRSFFEGLDGLASVIRLRPDPDALARPSLAATDRPTLEANGANLPTLLQHLAGERDGRLERIEADLRRLVPEFRRVHTPPTTIEVVTTENIRVDQQVLPRTQTSKVPGHRLELEFAGIGRVAAEHVSEGTLLALGLLTFLHAEPPRVVLIDDADRALHPAAQQQFVGLLKALLAERPEVQVVMTTHSPDLVDACAPEEIRVMGRGPDGGVHIAELTAHPDAPRWLQRMRVGEFWSTVGEGWVPAEPRA